MSGPTTIAVNAAALTVTARKVSDNSAVSADFSDKLKRFRHDGELAGGSAMVVPCAFGEGVRHVLRKDAHGVLARGNDAAIVHALEVELAPERIREFSAASGGEAGLPFGPGERSVDLAVVVRFQSSGARGEVG